MLKVSSPNSFFGSSLRLISGSSEVKLRATEVCIRNVAESHSTMLIFVVATKNWVETLFFFPFFFFSLDLKVVAII